MMRWLLVVLALVAGAGSLSSQEETPPALSHYKGRRIAATMHFQGAPWLTRRSRDREEDGETLLESLALRPGMVVCDLGCGNGFHTLRLAERVGSEGRVYAVDIQEQMLTLLRQRARKADLAERIVPTLGTLVDPKLPDGALDLIVLVDVYHEFSHPQHMLRALRRSLKPDGRIVLVEFRKEDPGVPIKHLHKMSRGQVLREMIPNGFKLVSEYTELPWQHVLFFQRDPDREPEPFVAEEAKGELVPDGETALAGSGISGTVSSRHGLVRLARPGGTRRFDLRLPDLIRGPAVVAGTDGARTRLVRLRNGGVRILMEEAAGTPLDLTITYERAPTGGVDVLLEGKPRRALAGEGFLGLVLRSPLVGSTTGEVRFVGAPRAGAGKQDRWLRHRPEERGDKNGLRPSASRWNPRWAGEESSSAAPPARAFLAPASSEYALPVFFHRAGDEVLVWMFERTSMAEELRLTTLPADPKGGPPSWNLVLLERGDPIREPFAFRFHVDVLPWTNTDAILDAYQAWSEEHVTRPR